MPNSFTLSWKPWVLYLDPQSGKVHITEAGSFEEHLLTKIDVSAMERVVHEGKISIRYPSDGPHSFTHMPDGSYAIVRPCSRRPRGF